MKKNKVFLLAVLFLVLLQTCNDTKVFATHVNFIYHKNLSSNAITTTKPDDTRQLIQNIKRVSDQKGNANLDLFINKEGEIFVFHPARNCKNGVINFSCSHLNQNFVFNTPTRTLTTSGQFKLFTLKRIMPLLKNASSITMELKNFTMLPNSYSLLRNILSNEPNQVVLKKTQFESFNASDYLELKKMYPNNFIWKLIKSNDNINYWINLANHNSKLGLSFETNAFSKNEKNQMYDVLNKYKNPNICFWTFMTNIKSNWSVSQKDFFEKLLNTNKFFNLNNIYVFSEVANYDPFLLEKGTKFLENQINTYKISQRTATNMYKKFLNQNDGTNFINYKTQQSYASWLKSAKDEIAVNKHRGFTKVDGKAYYFNQNGTVIKGFKTLNHKIYYFDSKTGVQVKGFKTLNHKTYYFDSKTGVQVKGFKTLNHKTYYFDIKTGVQVKGFKTLNHKTYYFDSKTGIQTKGFSIINGKLYYFDYKTGVKFTGLKRINFS